MEILKQSLNKCEECGKMCGHIIEKYNGLVPVYCRCDLSDKEKKLANPSAICCETETLEPLVTWKPGSSNREKDGSWWHTTIYKAPKGW